MDDRTAADRGTREARALQRANEARRRAAREHDTALADDEAARHADTSAGREQHAHAASTHRAAEKAHLDAVACHERAASLQAEHTRHLDGPERV